MQTSNSLALYAWFIATLAGSHSFHLVRALSRSPSLDGAYIIYLRSKKVNILERVFLHIFLVFRAFHVVLTLFWIISVDFIEILRFSCKEHHRNRGNPLEKQVPQTFTHWWSRSIPRKPIRPGFRSLRASGSIQKVYDAYVKPIDLVGKKWYFCYVYSRRRDMT